MLENDADVVNQQCLRMLAKLLNQNIFHSENLLVKLIVLLAGMCSFEIFDMVMPGRGNTCLGRLSNHAHTKIKTAMFTGKVIAAYVWWKPKHLVRKGRPSRKMVTLCLIDWNFFSQSRMN